MASRWRLQWCGTHFQKQHLTVDHIIAQSKGGTDHIENLQLLSNLREPLGGFAVLCYEGRGGIRGGRVKVEREVRSALAVTRLLPY